MAPASAALHALAAAVRDRLLGGGTAVLPGVGTLSRVHVPARLATDDAGRRVLLPPGETVAFTGDEGDATPLAALVVRYSGHPQADPTLALRAAMDQLEAKLAATGEVGLAGVGAFQRTSSGVRFAAAPALRSAVNRAFTGLRPIDATPPAPPAAALASNSSADDGDSVETVSSHAAPSLAEPEAPQPPTALEASKVADDARDVPEFDSLATEPSHVPITPGSLASPSGEGSDEEIARADASRALGDAPSEAIPTFEPPVQDGARWDEAPELAAPDTASEVGSVPDLTASSVVPESPVWAPEDPAEARASADEFLPFDPSALPPLPGERPHVARPLPDHVQSAAEWAPPHVEMDPAEEAWHDEPAGRDVDAWQPPLDPPPAPLGPAPAYEEAEFSVLGASPATEASVPNATEIVLGVPVERIADEHPIQPPLQPPPAPPVDLEGAPTSATLATDQALRDRGRPWLRIIGWLALAAALGLASWLFVRQRYGPPAQPATTRAMPLVDPVPTDAPAGARLSSDTLPAPSEAIVSSDLEPLTAAGGVEPPGPEPPVPSAGPPRAPVRVLGVAPPRDQALLPPRLAGLSAADAEALANAGGLDTGTGGVTWVVLSSPSASEADALAARYRESGYRAGVVSTVEGGRSMFRVGVGQFSSRDDALRLRDRLPPQAPPDTWPLRLR